MKWEADQRNGYFGWTVGSGPPQMRWRERVNLDDAREAVQDVLARWWMAMQWPDAQPYSGGVLDAWPARIADGLVICRSEWAAVMAMVSEESKVPDGGH